VKEFESDKTVGVMGSGQLLLCVYGVRRLRPTRRLVQMAFINGKPGLGSLFHIRRADSCAPGGKALITLTRDG